MIIQANKYISSAFSEEDASTLLKVIDETLAENDEIIIDFIGVVYYTSLFFNIALSSHMEYMSKDEYDRRIKSINLREIGEETYKHSYDRAVMYYSMTEEEREAQMKIISEEIDLL